MSGDTEKHKEKLEALYRQAKEEAWTPQLATLLLLSGGILIATVFFNVAVFSFGHWIVALIVYLVEALAPLFLFYSYRRNIRERVRRKALELDATDPGIYQAYDEWRTKTAPPK